MFLKLKSYSQPIQTSTVHKLNTTIAMSFFLMQCVFITLYISKSWFSINLTNLIIICFISLILLAFIILNLLELNIFNIIAQPILSGKPLIVYRQWLSIDEINYKNCLTFGLKHISFEVIDELKLNFWGNLEIKSKALSGQNTKTSETILTIPFSCAEFKNQKLLIDTIKKTKPDVLLNKKLINYLEKPLIAKAQYFYYVTIIILIYLLADINFTTFNYLETLKNYYYSISTHENLNHEQKYYYFKKACQLENYQPKYSYIWNKFFKEKIIANNFIFLKAKYYFSLNDTKNSLAVLQNGLSKDKKNFRLELLNARILTSANQYDKADKSLIVSSDLHETKILPRFYRFCIAVNNNDTTKAQKLFKEFRKNFDDKVFGDQDNWPPFSGHFIDDIWFQEDFEYIFQMLLKQGYKLK